MSATTTTSALPAKAKTAFNRLKGGLLKSYENVAKTGLQATLARIEFGGLANQAVAAMIAADKSTTAEAAQNAILEALRAKGFRVTSWSTIGQWQGASEGFNSIPEKDRLVIAQNGGVHAFNRLKSVTAKNGARAKLAADLVKAGTVTFDDVSDAVTKFNAKGKPKASPKQQTQKIVDKHKAITAGPVRSLASSGLWSPEVQALVTLAAQHGYRMGRGGKALVPFERAAIAELMYFGPVADAAQETEND